MPQLCVCVRLCVCAYFWTANSRVCVDGQSLQLIALSVASPGGRCHWGHHKTNDLNVNLIHLKFSRLSFIDY